MDGGVAEALDTPHKQFGGAMSFNELELKRINRTVGELCRRRTLPEFAGQLRFECEVHRHTVSIWEVRPPWDGVGGETRMGVARFRFVRSQSVWQLYWMRRDLKWHRYGPAEQTPDLAALVAIVEADEYCAFFG